MSDPFAPPQPLSPGHPAPWFVAQGPETANYGFHTVAGRYIVLGFLPDDRAAREPLLAAVRARRSLFDGRKAACFLVARDPETMATAVNEPPGIRWLFDPEGKVGAMYGPLDAPQWLLLDPALRVVDRAPIASTAVLDALPALPEVEDYAGVPLNAPVLIVPRVFERELCRRLIDLYDAHGGAPSGVMRDVGGRTVGVLDDMKRRSDAPVEDPELRRALLARIRRRLLPEIEKAFQFTVTRLERYIVACYDADSGGWFRPHRDNQTMATRHRRFAVSINLNSEAFEGGDLRFPEFGPRTYRPPTGGAVVFCCTLLHEATPVTRGRRYAFLPFLYDEAGAEIRRESEAFLDVAAGGKATG
ncbi:2OG-Fe(II) oxygenase [Phenylobacterium sp.]|uniref:2OG-Fe(II) oxygenase n=1 Tax=Phenylobacterium sp. TaxID=1871053 RepID=UPI002F91E394